MKSEEYFKSYPGSKACHQTSDGLIFHQEGDARLHAKSLEDDAITEHKKGAVKKSVPETAEPEPVKVPAVKKK